MNPKTDEELVVLIKQGDLLAFEEIVKRYQQRLFSFVIHVVSDRSAAEEVVIDSLFQIYKTIDRVDTSKKFSSYIFAVAKNAAISKLRQHKYTIQLDKVEHEANEDASLYEQLVMAETQSIVQKAVRSLSEKYRAVISLYYFDDLSYEEISKKLRIPVGTVRTHLARAKDALKSKLYETY